MLFSIKPNIFSVLINIEIFKKLIYKIFISNFLNKYFNKIYIKKKILFK